MPSVTDGKKYIIFWFLQYIERAEFIEDLSTLKLKSRMASRWVSILLKAWKTIAIDSLESNFVMAFTEEGPDIMVLGIDKPSELGGWGARKLNGVRHWAGQEN